MRLRQLIEALYVCGFAFCAVPAWAAETGRREDARPSPVRDLDEPHPIAVPQDATGRRDLACFLFSSSGGETGHVRAAYDMMRSAARLGDRDAPLYLAKFLRAGFVIERNNDAARLYLARYLYWFLDDANSTFERMDRLRAVERKVSNNDCGPASDIGFAEIEALAPPPGLANLRPPRTKLGSTGFLSAASGPESEKIWKEAPTYVTSAATREKACTVYRGANNDPLQKLRAYLLMRIAADCGDDTAALYVSAFLRFGYGADRNTDLAREYLHRVISNTRVHSIHIDGAALIQQGDCAPADPEGAALISRAYLTPAR